MYFGRYFYPFLLQQVTCDKKRGNVNDKQMPFATLFTFILFYTCLGFWTLDGRNLLQEMMLTQHFVQIYNDYEEAPNRTLVTQNMKILIEHGLFYKEHFHKQNMRTTTDSTNICLALHARACPFDPLFLCHASSTPTFRP